MESKLHLRSSKAKCSTILRSVCSDLADAHCYSGLSTFAYFGPDEQNFTVEAVVTHFLPSPRGITIFLHSADLVNEDILV